MNYFNGIVIGLILGILMPVILFTPFITGDSLLEFIEDGGNVIFVIVYYAILGIIIGFLVVLITNKISRSKKENE